MATLSANSRRSSAASSVSSSPRPSLTGTAVATSVPPVHMSSLNEEEYSPDVSIADHPDNAAGIRLSKDNICTERSDSGFSECSNSSGNAALNGLTLAAHPLFDKANSITEEKCTADTNHSTANTSNNTLNEMCGKVSVNMLKLKLEKIAEAQTNDTHSKPPLIARTVNITNGNEEPKPIAMMKHSKSALFDMATVAMSPEEQEIPIRATLARSTSLQLKKVVDKEPIMKSDFTNTIKMRKTSLESNVLREKLPTHSSPRVLLENSGKVSKLLQRFSNESSPTGATVEDLTEKNSQENALIECTSTPLTAIAVAQQQVVTKVVVAKTTVASKSSTVSNQSVKRSPMQERKTRTAIIANSSLNRKCVFDRLSPTRHNSSLTNTRYTANASQSISKINKKSINTVESIGPTTTTTTAAAATTATAKSSIVTTIAPKSTAYASFNRTSPVRLSGRVKEVTDRLSTPKIAIKKPIAIRPTTGATPANHSAIITTKSNAKLLSAVNELSTATAIVTPTTITSTTQMRQSVTNTMSIENYQKFVSNKVEGDFAAQSKKLNENFKKASAFWKTT